MPIQLQLQIHIQPKKQMQIQIQQLRFGLRYKFLAFCMRQKALGEGPIVRQHESAKAVAVEGVW